MKTKTLLPLLTLALLLSACGTGTPEAIPTIVLDAPSESQVPASGREIIASAVILPARNANLAFLIGGNIQTLNVQIGEEVQKGQILAELDNTLLQLELERAERALRELTSPAQIALAEEALAIAQDELEEAQHKVDALDYRRASDTTIDKVKAEISLAEKQLALASDAYKQFSQREDGDPKKAAALLAMTNAQIELNRLQTNYNWYTGSPSETDIALTQAQLNAAQAAYQESKWLLAELQGEEIPSSATGARLAQIQEAKNNLTAAQNRLAQSHLVSPFDGVITQISTTAGEYAPPGKTLIVISDMAQLEARTTDLSERDVIKVKVGNPATITVDALHENFRGKVVAISPVANTLGGDVVYEVIIAFDEMSAGVLGGMSAEVSISE